MRRGPRWFVGIALALMTVSSGCSGGNGSVTEAGDGLAVDPPAAPGALAPDLAIVGGVPAMTWLEPLDVEGTAGHRLRFSRLVDGLWTAPVTIAWGSDFFANWADLPGVVEAGNGTLLAHWLAKTDTGTYAYSIFLARSVDGGATWEPFRRLNADLTPTEHGFVSWVPEASGARAFWLDGREMIDGGTMQLRTVFVGDKIGLETILDERTCECCSTAAARAAEGPVVVYRGRSDDEVRDIRRILFGRDGWSGSEVVHADGWRIEGCPVNGPQVAADEEKVAVAWFTGAQRASGAAGDSPGAVKLAWSVDGAGSFAAPIVIDTDGPLGRVDVAIDQQGTAWMSWMRVNGPDAEIRLQRVGQAGSIGAPRIVATTLSGRASGFPRLAHLDGWLYLTWIDRAADQLPRLRLLRIPVA